MLGYRYFELQKLLCDSLQAQSDIYSQDLGADVRAKSQTDVGRRLGGRAFYSKIALAAQRRVKGI